MILRILLERMAGVNAAQSWPQLMFLYISGCRYVHLGVGAAFSRLVYVVGSMYGDDPYFGEDSSGLVC